MYQPGVLVARKIRLSLKIKKQPGFIYGPFAKHCKMIKTFRETGSLNHICKNRLDKACFAHKAAYFDSRNLKENYC